MTNLSELAQQIHDAGGESYYVGGYVRDELLGKESKDIDIEILEPLNGTLTFAYANVKSGANRPNPHFTCEFSPFERVHIYGKQRNQRTNQFSV